MEDNKVRKEPGAIAIGEVVYMNDPALLSIATRHAGYWLLEADGWFGPYPTAEAARRAYKADK